MGSAATMGSAEEQTIAASLYAHFGQAASFAVIAVDAPIVSPMRSGVDSACFKVTGLAGDGALFAKVLNADARPFVDWEAALAGAVAAAAAGIAPAVRMSDAERQVTGFAWLGPEWRAAFLNDLYRPAVLTAALAAKRKFQAGSPLSRRWNVFDRIAFMSDLAARSGLALPSDFDCLRAASDRIGAAIQASGIDELPCHNDGCASNIMLGPQGAVQLVDYDCAGQADPSYDVAVLLNEACSLDEDWLRAVELADGRVDTIRLNRYRAYAVADDLMWGLWGIIQSSLSPRRFLEFLKYGEWRLLRCRMGLAAQGFDARLHNL